MAKVLIVDDDEIICSILENIIRTDGHECVTAFDAGQARAALERAKFDLVTLDIDMPGESGLDLLGFIHNAYPDMAAIMISHIEDPETAKQALEAGAYGYISKPFEREEVIIGLHNALRRRDLEAMARTYRGELESTITRRSKELVESEAKYRDLVQSVNSVIIRVDRAGRITFCNDFGFRFFGYSADELIGHPIAGTIAPPAECSQGLSGRPEDPFFVDPGGYTYYEYENVKKNGQRVWMAWTGKPVADPRDRTDEVLLVGTDITDRIRAEEAVKEKERQLRFILDSIAAGIMIVEPETHTITDVNTTACDMIGRAKEDLIGRECHEFICPTERGRCPFTDLGKEVDHAERIILAADGREIPVIKTVHPVLISDREQLLETFLDISEVKRIQEDLRVNEERYRTLFNNANEGIYIAQDRRVKFPNPKVEEISGYSKEELESQPFANLIHPEDVDMVVERYKKRLQGENGPSNYIFRIIHKTGGIRYVELHVMPFTWEDAPATLNFITDVTERIQSEKAIRDSEERYRTLVEAMREGLIFLDAEFNLEFYNTRFSEMLGYSADEMSRMSLHRLLGEDAARHMIRKGKKAKEGGEESYELALAKKNGDKLLTMVHPVSLFDDGAYRGLLAVLVDITEKKMMEQRLNQAQKLESIGQLAAGVAHEINTPTQFIYTNIEFLEESCDALLGLAAEFQKIIETARAGLPVTGDQIRQSERRIEEADLDFLVEEVPESLSGALDGVRRISRIVDSMKYFSHPGGGDRKPIDVNDAVRNAVTITTNEWKYSTEVVTDLDDSLPPLPCFAAEFSQVLLNLIINAVHAISESIGENPEEKGTIWIRTRQDDGWLELRIRDTGAGIPENIRPRIFDPFFTTKDLLKGTGQGLSIAHGVIVEMHGGTIDFETEIGRGTTFVLRLPIEPVENVDD